MKCSHVKCLSTFFSFLIAPSHTDRTTKTYLINSAAVSVCFQSFADCAVNCNITFTACIYCIIWPFEDTICILLVSRINLFFFKLSFGKSIAFLIEYIIQPVIMPGCCKTCILHKLQLTRVWKQDARMEHSLQSSKSDKIKKNKVVIKRSNYKGLEL